MFAGRPHEVVGNGSPRWMITVSASAEFTGSGLQIDSSLHPAVGAPQGPRVLARSAEVVVEGANEASGVSAQHWRLLLARHHFRQRCNGSFGR